MKNTDCKILELKKLEEEMTVLERKLGSLKSKYGKLVQKSVCRCMSDFEYKKFNLKSNKIVNLKRKFKRCGDRSMKNDFLFVIAERYGVEMIFADAGYGDDDTFAVVHRIVKYRVCPKCGGMTEICGSIKDVSEDWSRSNWSREKIEEIKGKFIPKDFDENKEKVLLVGNKKECDKMFRVIG